ncbi:MAG: MBL fold metallo-hydrolase, partial [Rhodanobacteraceae bacterium]
MEGYERLSGDIACIDTYQHSSGMAACYLVGTDGHYAFVESGTSLSVPHVMKVLAELGVARGARHMIDPSKLIAGATAAYGPDIVRATYGEILPVPESRVIVADVAADRDFTLDLGSRRLLFIDSPGHARHHYAIWDEATRGWFSGDIFGVSYREFDDDGRGYMVPTTTPVQFDPEAWEASLAR